MDLSNITFNQNHKLEAAAKDAATGMRLLLLAFCSSVAVLAVAIATKDQPSSFGVSASIFALSVLGFAAGAYGSYLAASALDWSGLITGIIVLSVFIPYLKFISFVLLVVFSIDLIRKAGYRVSFIGALRKRAIA